MLVFRKIVNTFVLAHMSVRKVNFAAAKYSSVGDKIFQTVTGGTGGVIGTAVGYVASYDTETKVLKYFVDRSLYFN